MSRRDLGVSTLHGEEIKRPVMLLYIFFLLPSLAPTQSPDAARACTVPPAVDAPTPQRRLLQQPRQRTPRSGIGSCVVRHQLLLLRGGGERSHHARQAATQ